MTPNLLSQARHGRWGTQQGLGAAAPAPAWGVAGQLGTREGTRARWGPLRTAALLQAGSAVTATRPLRLRSPHPCADPEGAQPPGLRGRGLSTAGLGRAHRDAAPGPCHVPGAMCHVPGHACAASSHARPVGTDPSALASRGVVGRGARGFHNPRLAVYLSAGAGPGGGCLFAESAGSRPRGGGKGSRGTRLGRPARRWGGAGMGTALPAPPEPSCLHPLQAGPLLSQLTPAPTEPWS